MNRGSAVAYLTPGFLGAGLGSGSMHSRFSHACNIAFTGEDGFVYLLTVTLKGERLPDSISAEEADFKAILSLPEGTAFRWRPGELLWQGAGLALLPSPWTGRMQPGTLAARNILRAIPQQPGGLFEQSIKKAQVALRKTAVAVFRGESGDTWAAALPFIGLGRGLTPAFDDALVGLSAVAHRRGIPLPPLPALGGTTDISAKYLCLAQAGFFSQRVLSVFDKEHTQAAINALAAYGGTSGRDILWGVWIACDYLTREGLA